MKWYAIFVGNDDGKQFLGMHQFESSEEAEVFASSCIECECEMEEPDEEEDDSFVEPECTCYSIAKEMKEGYIYYEDRETSIEELEKKHYQRYNDIITNYQNRIKENEEKVAQLKKENARLKVSIQNRINTVAVFDLNYYLRRL